MKKRTKKLLFMGPRCQIDKSFLLLFFKKEGLASCHLLAFLSLASGGALAQEPAANRFPQPVRVGDLIDRTVRQPRPDRPILGHVTQVVRSSDGTVKLVVDYGGVFGLGSRPIAVPANAMALLGVEVEILGYTPAQLAAFPTYRESGDVPVGSDETIRMALASPSH